MKFHDGYRYIVLCEDRQTESFVLHILKQQGVNIHKIRVEKATSGRGSAEAFVKREYPKRLQAMRSLNYNKNALIVCIDADVETIENRKKSLEQACREHEIPVKPRSNNECVMIWIPKRNIETWIRFFALSGSSTDEVTEYRHHTPVPCREEAMKMSSFLQRQQEYEIVLPSLDEAREEYECLCKAQE